MHGLLGACPTAGAATAAQLSFLFFAPASCACTQLADPSACALQAAALELPDAYTGAMIPTNEDARVHSVCNLGIMNTPADPRFDDITKLVSKVFSGFPSHTTRSSVVPDGLRPCDSRLSSTAKCCTE